MIFNNEHAPVNPTLEYAEAVKFKAEGCTGIISRGGGSTIDVGKWVAKELHVKHTVIPTTAGTGSEVTKYCVLTVDGKKTTYTDEEYIPTSYILNPAEVVTCPPEVTLSAGLDAYAQALESWWSRNATAQSRRYSDAAILLVEENLKKSLDNRFDERIRMNMLIAANMSGRAINITRTNVCHAISYPLTEVYGIPHGIACSMSLAYFARKFIGLDIHGFLQEFTFPKYKFDAEVVAEQTINNIKLRDCPIFISRDDIIKSLCP